MTAKEIMLLCRKVKAASALLALAGTDKKDAALRSMARALVEESPNIIKANIRDVELARKRKVPAALIDRLTLTDARIRSMADSLLAVSKLNDPVGEVLETVRRPNGLVIKKVRVPIGVILMIYESRPNVTSD